MRAYDGTGYSLVEGSAWGSTGCGLVKGESVICYLVRYLGMTMLRNARGFAIDETKWLVFVALGLGLVADFAT